ncbi:hypothetical protein PFFCH_00152 [Plasmodium falciparum FCH/4]|uniref:Activator of Hsp90 ATPase homologue 1/2-like C-terminal domain-containing protein n=1 Tax=Plasmodium falciparum FCH/4 TaxID=1036724 RepID=A0A024VUM0_PLAFA|nr:hypothetical protein PFFCH_00152 [Plasmodium falciparum FCH/4]
MKRDLKVGGKFSLFSGSILGEFTEITKPHKIVEKWKFRDWNECDYSTVTVEFISVKENHTKLKLTHNNIPASNKYNEAKQRIFKPLYVFINQNILKETFYFYYVEKKKIYNKSIILLFCVKKLLGGGIK